MIIGHVVDNDGGHIESRGTKTFSFAPMNSIPYMSIRDLGYDIHVLRTNGCCVTKVSACDKKVHTIFFPIFFVFAFIRGVVENWFPLFVGCQTS